MTSFFVGGAERAGTTVLQSLLCQAPGTNPMIMEVEYLTHLVKDYARAKSSWNSRTEDYFDSPDSLRRFHSEFIGKFLKITASRYDNARHLVLKHPGLTRRFPDLFELLPAARFIVILRDPRDAIASMVEVGRKEQDEGQMISGDIFQERSMPQLSNYFKGFYAPILNAKDAELAVHTYFLKYEDLVTDPAAQLPGLRKFTGLDLDLHLSDQSQTDSVFHRMLRTHKVTWRTENFSRPLNPSSIGRHRMVLSPKEIREIEKHCQDFLTACRYV